MTVESASLTVKRDFGEVLEKNSQNSLVLDSSFFKKDYFVNQGGSAANLYKEGNLNLSNSPVIDQRDEIVQTTIEKRTKKKDYSVLPGDTISSIAKKFNVSQDTIINENNIKKGFIKVGQELIILPVSGLSYTIKKGDNLWLISKRFSVERSKILEFNGITSVLKIGQKIIIPNGKKPKYSTKKYSSKPVGSDFFPEIELAGNGNLSGYVNWRGVVPFGKGAKINVSKRKNGRYRYTKRDYGYFTHPAPNSTRTQGAHHRNGVDMGAPIGKKIYAAASGIVTSSYYGGWGGGYGNHILIKHPNGIITMYAHLSQNNVSKGEKVKKGQVIGKMGNTGRSTGPHLHFEVRGAYNPF